MFTISTSVMMHNHNNGKVFCMWEQLIEFSKAQLMPGIKSRWVEEATSRMQSRTKQRKRKRRYKQFLHLIIVVRVRSLADKTDELGALMRTQHGCKNNSLRLYGQTETQHRKLRGVTVHVNNRWCNPGHVTEKERLLLCWTVSCDQPTLCVTSSAKLLQSNKNGTPIHSRRALEISTTPFSLLHFKFTNVCMFGIFLFLFIHFLPITYIYIYRNIEMIILLLYYI